MKALFTTPYLKLAILSTLLSFELPPHSQITNSDSKTSNDIFCGNNEFSIVAKNQKQGIYDNKTEKFVIKPRLSFFCYFAIIDVLFEIQETRQIVIYNLGNAENPWAPIQLENCSTQLILQGNTYWPDFGNIGLNEGKLSLEGSRSANLNENFSNLLRNDLTNNISRDAHFLFGIDLHGHFATIYNYDECHWYDYDNFFPLKSVIHRDSLNHGEFKDSVDAINNIVYSWPDLGFQQTGLYNLKYETWDIPPIYKQIHYYNNYYFALREVFDTTYRCHANEQHYDIYTVRDDRVKLTNVPDTWTNGGFNSRLLFSGKKIWLDKDSSYVFVQTDSGIGLYQVQLFDTWWSIYDYNPLNSKAIFGIDTLFNPIYKTVIKSGRYGSLFLTYDGNHFEAFEEPQNGELLKIPIPFKKEYYHFSPGSYYDDYLIDDLFYTHTNPYSNIPELSLSKNSPPKKHTAKYGMSVLNDSLIYVHCFVPEDWNNARPLTSFLHPGEDSLNEEGKKVCDPPRPGIYESGIYNQNQNDWLIPNEYVWIQTSPSGYLLCTAILNHENNFVEYRYSFRSLGNKVLFQNVTLHELPTLGIDLNEFGLK